MNRLTPLHLEHLDYTLKRLSSALSSTRHREQTPYDMQPLIHCLDILDKGVRRAALLMNKEWPQPKMAEAQAALETLGPQSAEEAPVMDASGYEAALEKEAAKGFFSRLPWEGEGAARPDDSSISPSLNPEKPSIMGSATTTPSQATAAGYFSSLPWQHEEQAQCNKKRSPLHIQSGASALRGKQSTRTAAPNPILAATHSAIETIRSASLDNQMPQEDEHDLDQPDEKQTNIGQKQNEHSSSNDKPANAPQARDNL